MPYIPFDNSVALDSTSASPKYAPFNPNTMSLDSGPGTVSRIGRIAGEAVSDIGNEETRPFIADKTAGPEWLQRIGDIGSRAAGIAGDIGKAATATVQGPLESGYRSLEDTLAPNAPESLKEQHARDFGDVAALPVSMGIAESAEAVPAIGAALKDTSPKAFLKNEATGSPDVLPTVKPKPLDSNQVFNEINNTYGERMDKANTLFDDMRATAAGKTMEAPGVKSTLDDIISDIQSDPNHEARPYLKTLQNVRDKITEDGDMDLADAVKTKQMLNRNFNPKRFSDASESPYIQLSKSLDHMLSNAAEVYPEFGQSKEIADDYWRNKVIPMRDNPVLNRLWKPQDHFNQESVNSGRLDEMPDETQERADDLLKNITNRHEYKAVARALPEDVADSLRAAKIKDLQGKAGYVAPAIKTVGSLAKGKPMSAFKNFMNIGADYTPEQERLLKELSTSTLNKNTGNVLEGVISPPERPMPVSGGPSLPSSASPSTAIGYNPVKVTPTSGVMGVNAAGEATPFSVEEEAAHEALRRQGLSPDVRRATMQRQTADIAGRTPLLEYNPESTREFENTPTDELRSNLLGEVQPATRLQKAQADALREHLMRLGYTPDIIKAQAAKNAIPPAVETQIRRFAKTMGIEPSGKNIDEVTKELDDFLDTTDIPPFLRNMPKSSKQYARGGSVPTEKQIAAGNYKKGHVKMYGMDISIENPKGSERSGTDKNGKKWSVKMPHHYGYIKGTIGADKDHVDCFLGDNKNSRRVYVIDQKDPSSGRFDEHKCMLGFSDRDNAVNAYKSAFSDKKNRIMKVTRFTIPEFKDWLKKGNTKLPVKKAS